MCVCVCHNSFVEGKLVLNLYHVGPKDKIQVSRLGGKHIYLQAFFDPCDISSAQTDSGDHTRKEGSTNKDNEASS